MRIFADEAREKFSGKHVLPVVVTNYVVSPEEREELEGYGVKVVKVEMAKNLEAFPQDFAQIVGLTAHGRQSRL